MKIACACVVKNAETRISEWIAFQFAVGFDSVIILDNRSDDNTRSNAILFSGKYDVRVVDWPLTLKSYQTVGFEYIIQRYKNEFDWIACLDDDEFFVPPEGKKIVDILSVADEVASISLPWVVFGSNGHITSPAGLVISSYTRRGGADPHVKSIVRPKNVLVCLNPHSFVVNGLYSDLEGHVTVEPYHAVSSIQDIRFGKLHHYFCRSREDFDKKKKRGYHSGKRSELEFNRLFKRHDLNEFEDLSALKFKSRIREIINDVKDGNVASSQNVDSFGKFTIIMLLLRHKVLIRVFLLKMKMYAFLVSRKPVNKSGVRP